MPYKFSKKAYNRQIIFDKCFLCYDLFMQEITIGKKYRHYKGNVYKIIAFAKHSETTEDMVVYSSVKDGATWVRPLSMWSEVVDENNTLRFTLID